MTGKGYAVVGLDARTWEADAPGVEHAALSEALGATEVAVDAYRLGPDAAVAPPSALETLLVPLRSADALDVGGVAVGPRGLARVPAGVESAVRADGDATVLAVSAPADQAPTDRPVAVDLDAVSFEVPETSDVATAFLTAPLGCSGMKANARRLEPGQVVPYHTEGDQEELFVPIEGPATMRIADEPHETPVGTVVRVAPDVPRSAVNEGDTSAVWVMVGAPPTGGPTGWDPGAEILE